MGMNYYMEYGDPEPTVCEHCGGTSTKRRHQHIGKSSAGWCFSLHVDETFKSLADYERVWAEPDCVITDESGTQLEPCEMHAVITERKWEHKCDVTSDWYAQNYATPGPFGLARHRIGQWCVGHGNGTYDLIPGEFS